MSLFNSFPCIQNYFLIQKIQKVMQSALQKYMLKLLILLNFFRIIFKF